MHSLSFLPSASISADNFERFFSVAFWFGLFLFSATMAVAIYFAFRFQRKKEGELTAYLPGNYLVEFLSIFGVSIWVAIFFLWGWRDYSYIVEPKLNEYEINVIGQQWNWQIQYANGKTFTNEIFLPLGRPVKLIMTSKDVLHSFFLPEFRVKQDVVPGQFTALRFTANRVGQFHIFCAEYCGTAHSKMLGVVHVLEPKEFQAWLEGEKVAEAGPNEPHLTMVEQGRILFETKSCNACHSIGGEAKMGPSLKGLFGSQVELMDGSKVKADENYIRESIMDPSKEIVKNYAPQMPTFRGVLTDEEVNQLIAYLKTL